MLAFCRISMKTQNKDATIQSQAEVTRSKMVREAAEKSFTPNNNSVWVLLGVLFPFLMPLIRLVAHKLPDKHLVSTHSPADPAKLYF